MNLFIDTNIYLSFYHFTNDDLEELKKLGVLLDQAKIKLYLTDQVQSEFARNREAKIAEALEKLNEQKLKMQFPQICKDYAEYEIMQRLQKEHEEIYSKLREKLEVDIERHTLKADKIIQELFQKAHKEYTTKEQLENAKFRHEIGNPPGKRDSLGDAINWQLLLETVPANQEMYFITGDKDFYSKLNEESFNEFLSKEWKKEKKLGLVCYKRLAMFFKDRFPDIRLALELEKELAIKELALSKNFTHTHSIISRLSKFSEFTNVELNGLVEAALSNSQVYMIMMDTDVYEFFSTLIVGREEFIEENNLSKLKEDLRQAKEMRSIE